MSAARLGTAGAKTRSPGPVPPMILIRPPARLQRTRKGSLAAPMSATIYQYNPWLVFGLEGSIDGTSLKKTAVVPLADFAADTFGSATATSSAGVQGSIRGRLGMAWDRVLIYGTGGVAFTSFNTSMTDTAGFSPGFRAPTRASRTPAPAGRLAAALNMPSPTIGGCGPSTAIRISAIPPTFFFQGVLPEGGFLTAQHHLTENQVQVGFSYRFDWTAPGPVVPPGTSPDVCSAAPDQLHLWHQSPNIKPSIQIEDSSCLVKLSLACAGAFAAAATLAGISPALSHTIVGNRVFPATLDIDDPGVNDEFTAPAFSYVPNPDGSNAYGFGFRMAKDDHGRFVVFHRRHLHPSHPHCEAGWDHRHAERMGQYRDAVEICVSTKTRSMNSSFRSRATPHGATPAM